MYPILIFNFSVLGGNFGVPSCNGFKILIPKVTYNSPWILEVLVALDASPIFILSFSNLLRK